MNAKHTPGPWKIDRNAYERPAAINGGDNMRRVLIWGAFARRNSAEAECEANALLIAAAPDLLAFAQMIANGGINEAGQFTIESEARVLIAKATNVNG